jgi:hypothetical protein
MILIKKYSYFLEKINNWRKIKMAAKTQDGVRWTIFSKEI